MNFLNNKLNISIYIRNVASLTLASTFIWDYYRSPEILQSFSSWMLILHFIYFQLPLESRALPYLHSLSFVGANVIPVLYIYLIIYKPRLEIDHMNNWDLQWNIIILRLLLIYISPLIFHSLDLVSNQVNLINSYQAINPKLILIWSSISFFIYSILYELIFPDNEEYDNLQGISKYEYLRYNKIISIIVNCFAIILLHYLIFRKAYLLKFKNK